MYRGGHAEGRADRDGAGGTRQGIDVMGRFCHRARRGACRLIGGAAIGALLTTVLPNARAPAQGVVKSVFGDWQIRCDTPPGAQSEQCALIQSVTAEDRPNVGLTVIVLKTADQKSKLMRVLAP